MSSPTSLSASPRQPQDGIALQLLQQRLLAFERRLLAARPASRITDEVLAEWAGLRRAEIECRLAWRIASPAQA